ncbi:MAG: hypothetical protein LAT55_01350 [Opitutales bacterium]|nr:hypothetical protein [Opitutales bacterium]
MSLINDALKKAQQRQQGDHLSSPGASFSSGASPQPTSSAPAKGIMVVFAVSVLLVGLIGVGGWQVWRMVSGEETERLASDVSDPPETSPVVDDESPEIADRPSGNREGRVKAVDDTDDREEDSAEPSAARDPEVDTYLRNASITAREAGENSRVIINGRFYGLQEQVHFGDSLRIVEVAGGVVVFRDRRGAEYRHRL